MDFDQALVEQTYRPLAARYAAFYFGLPPPTPVIMGQMYQESAFNAKARSRTGATGLMQFMPATAKWAGDEIAIPAEPLSPAWAIQAGTWYDRFLYDRVRYKDDCNRWGAALGSYNGGLGWMKKRQGRAADPQNYWESVRFVNPGITAGNQHENETYAERIIYRHQARFVRVGDRKVCLL